MKTNDVDIRPMEEPLAELERELLAAYVSGAAPASAHRRPPASPSFRRAADQELHRTVTVGVTPRSRDRCGSDDVLTCPGARAPAQRCRWQHAGARAVETRPGCLLARVTGCR